MANKKDTKKEKQPAAEKSSVSETFSEIFKDKSTTSVVVATLILLLLSFFAFRYFGSSQMVDDKLNGEGASDVVVNTNQSGGETQTEEKDENGEVASAESEQVEVVEQTPEKETPTPEVKEVEVENTDAEPELISEEEKVENTPENQEDADQNKDDAQVNDRKGLKGFIAGIFAGKKISDAQKNKDDSQKDQTSDNKETMEDDSQVLGTGGADSYYDDTNWVANDYDLGSKNDSEYTVVSGDTLWEIAEAQYGNGADWVKIAQANNIGYLSNGAPLIHSGNVLTIPR